ncbi:MAG: GNAT family N-acetyltransferase [Bordetella sp.]|uniref:GNAT family N-acetyltransferase n=1 Tax=Bordetella sp. TaxID=28081 RepID=UPI003F7B971C
MEPIRLQRVESAQACSACFDLMRELRPHLQSAQAFHEQLGRQAAQAYRLLAAWDGEQAVALAGYRPQENLIYGRFVYIDDLVVASRARSRGLGKQMIDAVREEARQLGCAYLILDTGLANSLAQRFYFRQGMLSKGLHFSQAL